MRPRPLKVCGIQTIFPHWGKYAGPHQYARYLSGNINMSLIDGGFPSRHFFIKKIGSYVRGKIPGYNEPSFEGEFKAFGKFLWPGYDILHYFDGEHALGCLPVIFRKWRFFLRPPKIIATFHQPPDILKGMARPYILETLDLLISYSEEQAEFLRKWVPSSKIKLEMHGVRSDFFRPARKKENGKFVCLSVGFWRRDQQLLCDIAGALKDRTDIEFHWVCPSELRPKEDQNFFRFYEKISDESLLNLYQSADLLLLPLLEATANNALVEALACGLPALVTDLPSVRRYAGNAAMFLPNDRDYWVRAIEELKSDTAARSRMAITARQRAEELSWQRLAPDYEKIYIDLMSDGWTHKR